MSTHLDQSSVYELEKLIISNNVNNSMTVNKPQSKSEAPTSFYPGQTQTQKNVAQAKTPNRFRDSADKLSKKDEEHRQKTMEFNKEINDLNELHKKYDNAINTFESENRISVLKKSIVRKDYK